MPRLTFYIKTPNRRSNEAACISIQLIFPYSNYGVRQ